MLRFLVGTLKAETTIDKLAELQDMQREAKRKGIACKISGNRLQVRRDWFQPMTGEHGSTWQSFSTMADLQLCFNSTQY